MSLLSSATPKSVCDYKKKIQFKKINTAWKLIFVHWSSSHRLDSLGKAVWQWLTYPKLSMGKVQMQVINKQKAQAKETQCTSPFCIGGSSLAVVSSSRLMPDDACALSFPSDAAFSNSFIFFLVSSFVTASSRFRISAQCQWCHSVKWYRRTCFLLYSVPVVVF